MALAACGGGDALSKEDYENQFKAAVKRAESNTRPIGEPRSIKDAGRLYDDLARELGRLRADLAALKPPDAVAGPHRDFVAGLAEADRGTAKLAQAARRGDRAALREGLNGVTSPEVAQRANAARRAFDAKGYDIGAEPLR